MTRIAVDSLPPPPRPADRVVRLLGLGTNRPARVLAQAEAAEFAAQRCCDDAQQRRWLQRVYEQSTVQQRHLALLDAGRGAHEAFYPPRQSPGDHGPSVHRRMQAYARLAPPLAAGAARRALHQAGVPAEAVRQLVTVSCTGFTAPGLDMRLIDQLGLSPGVGRSVLGFMGCHGAVNGLRVARALASAQPGEPVLLCATELCSLHFQYGHHRQRIVADALFADGAAACVLQADAHQATAVPDPPSVSQAAAQWAVVDTASHLVPGTQGVMTWTIGEHGFRMTLSPRVPALVKRHLPGWLEPWLAGHGLSVADVAHWAVHPGGPRVLDAVQAGLNLPGSAMTPSREVLRTSGNMSSPTVLFIVERLPCVAGEGPCVALAFGPGLVIEAALLMPT